LSQIKGNRSKLATMELLKIYQDLLDALNNKKQYLLMKDEYKKCHNVIQLSWEAKAEESK
jgi:hypothetical protein